jgi:MFS transporter, OFA family, oxalate/formate antiporter
VLILFIIVFGFAVGGILSAFFVLIGDFYGRYAFPSVLRYLTIFSVIQLAGFFVAGQSYDRFGSYDAAYILFAVCNILAGLLILTARRPQAIVPLNFPQAPP